MHLRENYLIAHNIASATKPTLQKSITDNFSRRPQPEYNVFSRPLPASTNNFTTSWSNGIFSVTKLPSQENDLPVIYTTQSFQEFFKDFNFVSYYYFINFFFFLNCNKYFLSFCLLLLLSSSTSTSSHSSTTSTTSSR